MKKKKLKKRIRNLEQSSKALNENAICVFSYQERLELLEQRIAKQYELINEFDAREGTLIRRIHQLEQQIIGKDLKLKQLEQLVQTIDKNSEIVQLEQSVQTMNRNSKFVQLEQQVVKLEEIIAVHIQI